MKTVKYLRFYCSLRGKRRLTFQPIFPLEFGVGMGLTGTVELPLHAGGVPRWLISRMTRLAKGVLTIMVDEHGVDEVLKRFSDPLWFQAFSCVLGFDWNSSGTTTVTCAVVKSVLANENLGLKMAGGKGFKSLQTLKELDVLGEELNLATGSVEGLKKASRLSAKVDNAAVQDGYSIYHHVILVCKHGHWAVVQQGMNVKEVAARRYHWLSTRLKSFVNEPHSGIIGDRGHNYVLDMTAEESEACRRVCVDVAVEGPVKALRLLREAKARVKGPLDAWLEVKGKVEPPPHYRFAPDSFNWEVLKRCYELKPGNYEELLQVHGLGPATIRGLALIAELIYGERPSWKDPVKYSFAFGGKDGIPYPVNRRSMDEAISFLQDALESAELGSKEKLLALKRLQGLVVRLPP
ncbi:MAG: DUF763 domain-containing protein [Candidatus Nezhaarchaeales archaeon]